MLTAQSNWLRAINYYHASTFALDAADNKRQDALEIMRDCARRYVAHLTPAGEVVEIPWLEGHVLEGYFLPAPAASGRTPVVVCMGDPGHWKEEYLFKVARYARERGCRCWPWISSALAPAAEFEEVIGRRDLETSVGCVRDYLTTRDDVDEDRDSHSSAMGQGRPLSRAASLSTIVSPPWSVTAEFGICTSAPS